MAYLGYTKADPRRGSPAFIWTNAGTISAAASHSMTWEVYKPSSQYYAPFNFTRITNNSSVDITFYPNQDSDQGILVPAGSNVSIDKNIVGALWGFKITNGSATTDVTAGQLIVLSSREPFGSD